MAQSNNNIPLIAGIAALVVVGGGAAFFLSKNMTKEPVTVEGAAETAAPASGIESSEQQTGEAQGVSAELPVTQEEVAEAEKAAATFNGVTVERGNPVVARVDGKDISRVDVFRFIKMMPANVQQLPPESVYPIALDQVINTRLVQNKAEASGLENDPEVQQQVSMAKQQILRTVYVQRAVDELITESEIQAKYDELIKKAPDVEEVKAAHILVDSEAKAKDLIEKIKGGADFAKLAAEHSGDPGNKNEGGNLGWFTKDDMVPEFSQAAFKLGKGELSQTPVKTQFGWHVVKVDDKRMRAKPSFDEVKPMIQAELRREKLEGMLEGWKSAAKIERFDVNGKPLPQESVAPAAGGAPPSAEGPAAETPPVAEQAPVPMPAPAPAPAE